MILKRNPIYTQLQRGHFPVWHDDAHATIVSAPFGLHWLFRFGYWIRWSLMRWTPGALNRFEAKTRQEERARVEAKVVDYLYTQAALTDSWHSYFGGNIRAMADKIKTGQYDA